VDLLSEIEKKRRKNLNPCAANNSNTNITNIGKLHYINDANFLSSGCLILVWYIFFVGVCQKTHSLVTNYHWSCESAIGMQRYSVKNWTVRSALHGTIHPYGPGSKCSSHTEAEKRKQRGMASTSRGVESSGGLAIESTRTFRFGGLAAELARSAIADGGWAV